MGTSSFIFFYKWLSVKYMETDIAALINRLKIGTYGINKKLEENEKLYFDKKNYIFKKLYCVTIL